MKHQPLPDARIPTIYKYIPEQYVDGFLRSGGLLFRSLSYFKAYEEQQVRGDKHEGTRLHNKPEGLTLTKVNSGESLVFNGSFESTVQTDDIMVFCLSTSLSADLAHDFGANTCIEIHNPAMLIAGIRAALQRRSAIKNKNLIHAAVRYYDPSDNVGIEWAFPDRIALSKTKHYEKQKEYRIAFGLNNALSFENTSLRLVANDHKEVHKLANHREILLKIGDLRRCCTVWQFDPDGNPIKKT
ncbi:hypothetical protein [Pseudoduganella sp. R-34]|uniref:hypothetical protein n=1 Tax=Pseudoduganella sp. R-34 TaxID=3404062 RepID=UPI003CFA5D5D